MVEFTWNCFDAIPHAGVVTGLARGKNCPLIRFFKKKNLSSIDEFAEVHMTHGFMNMVKGPMHDGNRHGWDFELLD